MPDAWDDDWIAKGESSTAAGTEPASSSTKISKAERRAKQAEFNRQLWENAEDPQDNFFLRSKDIVPLKSDFKPAVKVLSRKPEKKLAANVEGIGQLNIDDDDESEDENKKPELTAEERREKAQRELEEKQKKYEEVKQRLFGNDQSSSTTTLSSPRRNTSKNSSPSRNQSWSKNSRDSRPSSSSSNKNSRLYDPNDTGKPGTSSVLRKETKAEPDELQPIRSPRAPDASGRGGFAPRGGRPA